MKKAEAEKLFVQQIINSGGVKGYYETCERGNYYYCLDLNDGSRRYWTNLSEESAERLGTKIRQ